MAMVDDIGMDGLGDYGLSVLEGARVDGALTYEGPVFLGQPARFKDCSMGAFAFMNSRGTTSAYRCHFGRFAQIGEQVIVGPPEHPQDWFSNHPMAFTQPEFMPHLYRMPEFARLLPDDDRMSRQYIASVPTDTFVGHEVYLGAKSFVRRGVSIGHGAVIGAASVVLDDVPPYAIVVGSPARVMRLRYDEAIVDRLLVLQWWHYDLAPFKHQVDFSQVEATLEFFEQRKADGELEPLRPKTRVVRCRGGHYSIDERDGPLYSLQDNPDHPAIGRPRPPRPAHTPEHSESRPA